MAQITYTDKVALNENPEIADINKVTDNDLNEIKSVVNDNYNNTIQITNTEPSDSDWKIWVDNSEEADNTYYNDNGTATQFKATTYDTLPVGTEVDYDGNTAPTGWTEIADIQPSIYSETETICGTWLGKPLYRKVFAITSLTYNAVTNYLHGIANVSFIKPTEVYMVNTNAGQVRSINYFGGWSNNLIQTNANAISYYISDSNFNEILAILEYTKTTD